MNDDKKLIDFFFTKTKESFFFLEKEFTFVPFHFSEDMDYLPDSRAIVRYTNNRTAIEISWRLVSAALVGVGIVRLNNGVMPSNHSYYDGKSAIIFNDYIECFDLDKENVLTKIVRQAKSKKLSSEEKLDSILSLYAKLLSKHGQKLYEGDDKLFETVQNFSRKKLTAQGYSL